MPSGPVIGFLGLKTSGNQIAKAPGSLLQAVNHVMTPANQLQQRRGQAVSSAATFGTAHVAPAYDKAYEMVQWGGGGTNAEAVLIHYGVNSSSVHGTQVATAPDPLGSAFTDKGAHQAREPENMRMKFREMAQSMYYTTSTGVFGLTSPTATQRSSGVPRAGMFQVVVNTNSLVGLTGNPAAGWMATDTAVGYRALIGRKDANNIVKLGPPNGRWVILNPADVSASLARTGGTTVTATVTAHNFQTGDILYISSAGSADFLAGTANPYTVTSFTATTIVWTNVGTGANVTLAGQTLSSGTKNTQLTIGLDASKVDIVAGDFVQLYRTQPSILATIDPGDEEFLCYERIITATDISNTYLTIVDTTPSSFFGPPLYTNANTGTPGGIEFEHLPPPLLTDITVYDGRLWGTTAVDIQTLPFRLLGTGAPSGLQAGDLLALNGLVYTLTPYIVTTYLPSRNIVLTATQIAEFINTEDATVRARTTVLPGQNTPTGAIVVERANLTQGIFYGAVSRQSAWQDAFPIITAVTEASSSRTANVVTITTSTTHGLVTGAIIVLAYEVFATPDANFPNGVKPAITVTSTTTFTYPETGSNATMSGTYFIYAATFGSTASSKQLRFSQPGEPEAWPLVNFPSGLPDGAIVQRIKSLNGSLYIFLEHGDIYTLSGAYPYTVQKFDGTASLVAPDTLIEHSGRLHCLTTQGLVAIGPRGVEVLSYDVDEELRRRAAKLLKNATSAIPFAISYESERQYQLWMPDEDATADATHWKCTGAYIYHSDSKAWTTWDTNSSLLALGNANNIGSARTCGVVLAPIDTLFMGGNIQSIYQEAKSFTWLDSADRLPDITVSEIELGQLIDNAGVFDQFVIGDVVKFPDGTYGTVTTTPTLHAAIINTTGSYSNINGGVCSVYRAIAPLTVEWMAATSGAPGLEKHWRDWQLHVDQFVVSTGAAAGGNTAAFTSPNYVVASNERTQDPTANSAESTRRTTVSPNTMTFAESAPYLQNYRGAIPDVAQRAAMEVMKLSPGRQAFTRLRLLGFTLTAEAISERTGR